MIKDINTFTGDSYQQYNSINSKLGNTIFFQANDFLHGQELWKTDGTEAGTTLFLDINPGAEGSVPTFLQAFGDRLFFSANDGVHGIKRWVTDGTEAGTVMLEDLYNTTTSLVPIARINDTFYFEGTDATYGTELWKTDPGGTSVSLVKDINTGSTSSIFRGVVAIGTNLLFITNDGVHGLEPWISDGTEAGTVLIKDIRAGSGNGVFEYTGYQGNNYYFYGYGAATGYELWKTDGTDAGTVLVKDILPGGKSSIALGYPKAILGNNFFFTATNSTNGGELWKTDGTDAGTMMLKDIYVGNLDSQIYNLQTIGDKLYISANDGISGGRSLWVSDGTEVGTVKISGGITPADFTSVGEILLFDAWDEINGYELWKSDGTLAGTSILKDIKPGYPYGYYTHIVSTDSLSFFYADDGSHGLELWRTDGTEAGTFLIKDINARTNDSIRYDDEDYISLGNSLIFYATDEVHGWELWKTDGTEAGTGLLKDIHVGSAHTSPISYAVLNNTLYFSIYGGSLGGYELWKTDGTEAGTVLFKDIWVGGPSNFFVFNNSVYFTASDGVHGNELWKTDGTDAGTVLLKDIKPGSGDAIVGYQTYPTILNGLLYFRADDGVNGPELWRSDGTEAGTYMVKDINPGATGSDIYKMIATNSTLIFIANDGVTGQELWKSNGTEATTLLAKDIWEGANSSLPLYLTVAGDNVFFSAVNAENGRELWKTNWNGSETVLVKDVFPGANSSYIDEYMAPIGNTVFFSAKDGIHGNELWKSDGTDAGTVLVKDIFPGAGESWPYYIMNIGNLIYFQAENGTDGYEVWRSDGTTDGTLMLTDLEQLEYNNLGNVQNDDPNYMTFVNNTLFFSAGEGIHGTELWKLNMDTTPPTGSIEINLGASYTTSLDVSLSLSASDDMSNVTEMMICNDTDFLGCSWEPFATSKDWTMVMSPGRSEPEYVYVKFKDAENNISIKYLDVIQFHTLTIDLTDIGLIGDITDTNPMTYSLNSNTQDIKGRIGQGNTIFFTYGGQTYSAIADAFGNFSITLILNDGDNVIQYYIRDISNNQSETKTLNLIVVPEVTQPAPTSTPANRWTLPNTGEEDLEETPTVSPTISITITETPSTTLRPSLTPTIKPSTEEQDPDYVYIGPIKIKKGDIQVAKVLSESVSNTGAVTMLIVAPLSLAILPQIFSKGFLWYLPPKKRKPWGVIYDLGTRKPIAFAIVRILDNTGKVLKETVSDLKGRYDFILDPGTYTMEIESGAFAKFTSQVTIRSTDEQHTEDVGLTKGTGINRFMLKEKLYYIYLYTFWTIGTIGLIFSGISLILGFDVLNLLILIFYAVQIYFLLKTRKPQNWGYVFDTVTDDRLTGVFVRILGVTDGRQLNVILTDEKGRFSLRLDEGDYLLKTDMPGYILSEADYHIETLPTGDKVAKINAVDLKNGVELGMAKA